MAQEEEDSEEDVDKSDEDEDVDNEHEEEDVGNEHEEEDVDNKHDEEETGDRGLQTDLMSDFSDVEELSDEDQHVQAAAAATTDEDSDHEGSLHDGVPDVRNLDEAASETSPHRPQRLALGDARDSGADSDGGNPDPDPDPDPDADAASAGDLPDDGTGDGTGASAGAAAGGEPPPEAPDVGVFTSDEVDQTFSLTSRIFTNAMFPDVKHRARPGKYVMTNDDQFGRIVTCFPAAVACRFRLEMKFYDYNYLRLVNKAGQMSMLMSDGSEDDDDDAREFAYLSGIKKNAKKGKKGKVKPSHTGENDAGSANGGRKIFALNDPVARPSKRRVHTTSYAGLDEDELGDDDDSYVEPEPLAKPAAAK